MKKILCPITGDTIFTIDARGIKKRENYAEAFFVLNDGSRMRVSMSKRAKEGLTKKQADDYFGAFKERAKKKEKLAKNELSKKQNLRYTDILDRQGNSIKK